MSLPGGTVQLVLPTAAAGKGRGIAATEDLQPGQLLLVTPPLALVEGPLGEIPEHDDLHQVMTISGAMYTSWQAAWLSAMVSSISDSGVDISSSATGSSSSAQVAPGNVQISSINAGSDMDLPDMLAPPSYSGWYAGPMTNAGAAASELAEAAMGSSEGRAPFEELGIDEEQLWGIIGK
eukprot:GHRR01031289.1.p2 GENE.GHRR01031289.1~~GHRR01031289.1.p2  ORF type:complete len:179 (+),score=97.39 GHRR01031289.1:748-1284(+)